MIQSQKYATNNGAKKFIGMKITTVAVLIIIRRVNINI